MQSDPPQTISSSVGDLVRLLMRRVGISPRWSSLEKSDTLLATMGVVTLVSGLSSGRSYIALLGLMLALTGSTVFVRRAVRTVRRTGRLRTLFADLARRGATADEMRERTLAYSDQIAAMAPEPAATWRWINEGVNSLISAGLYREALAFPERWSSEASAHARELDPEQWQLVQINLAEAEYNLGLVAEAKARMDDLTVGVERAASDGHGAEPIVKSGLAIQQAWIAALQGEHERGYDYLAAVARDAIPRLFHAEIDFTGAFLHLRAGRFDEAVAAAEQGLANAQRPSSERNGFYLLGIIHARAGEPGAADRSFERGAVYGYLGQGGDALVCWSEILEGQGRTRESRQALSWCIERDPQSPAAEVARMRLGMQAAAGSYSEV
jgi:tetratricopeptide (TPR) repeat protein